MATVSDTRRKPYYLNVGYFDAHGLLHQREEISSFLAYHNIDVMLLQETFLLPATYGPNIGNYKIIRHDRLAAPGGGTLIYYKKSLQINPLDNPKLDNIEVSACEVTLSNNQSLVLASVFLPSSKHLLESDIRAILDIGSSVILAGNLNSKHTNWNPSGNNRNGIKLYRLAGELNLDIFAPSKPTKYSKIGNQKSIIDIALFKDVTMKVQSIEVLNDLNSEHCPVVLKLRWPIDIYKPNVSGSNPKGESSCTAAQDLNETPESTNPSGAIDYLETHSTSSVEGYIETEPDINYRFCLPDDIRLLIRIKNRAKRLYSKRRNEENRLKLRCLERQIRDLVNEFRNSLTISATCDPQTS